MIRKLPFFLCVLLIYNISFSQSKRVLINGIVLNQSSKGLLNSHIVNLSTNEGTVTDYNGKFTIQARKGDWIQITNIQFIEKKIRITNGNFIARFFRIYLLDKTNLLDHFENLSKIFNEKIEIISSNENPIRELKKEKNMLQILPLKAEMFKKRFSLKILYTNTDFISFDMNKYNQLLIPVVED